MRKRLSFRRPAHGTVIAYLALFVALGGSAYAIQRLPRNSVGTRQLKANAVTGGKVKNGSLTGKDVDASTLGTVPTATRAAAAGHADSAGRADTASDAGSLQGLSPSAFVHGDGSVIAVRRDMAPESNKVPLFEFPGNTAITASCFGSAAGWDIRHESGGPVDTVYGLNSGPPVSTSLEGVTEFGGAATSPFTMFFHLATRDANPTIADIELDLIPHPAGDCTVWGQETIAR